MRTKRILIPLFRDEVAPRFDLATEVLLAEVSPGGEVVTQDYLLPHPSADGMCDLILSKGVDVVVCGAVEEEFYHYLRWKRVEVIDNIAGQARTALARYVDATLKAGDILFGPKEDAHAR